MDSTKIHSFEYWPALLIALFGLIIFLKQSLFDMDSYYFAGLACHSIPFRPDTDSWFTGVFFTNLPCDPLFFKALLIIIFTISVIITEKIGRLISSKYSQWLVFIFGSSLSFYSYFAKMEDDTLGLPFVLGSLYFLVKWSQSKKWIDFIIAMAICAIGFIVWKGIAIWGLIALSAGPFSWIIAGSILWNYRVELIPRFFPAVTEELPVAGIMTNAILLVGALALPTYFIPSVSLAFMLALIKLKYAIFLGILCGLGLFYYLVKKNFFEGDNKIVLGVTKPVALVLVLLVLNVSGIIGLYGSPPDQGVVDFIQRNSIIIKDANYSSVFNDWEYGHLVAYNGLHPSNQYGPPTPPFNEVKGFVITRQTTIQCPIIEQYKELIAYDCRD